VRLQTGDKDVHSGTTGGAARNPLGELCSLINDCYDARTGRVKIPGFYDDVRRISAAERRGLSRAGFSRRHFQLAHGLSSVRFPGRCSPARGHHDRTYLRGPRPDRRLHRRGLQDHRASSGEAKLSCRLVPDQTPAGMFNLIQRFVKQHCCDAEVIHESSLSPFLADSLGSAPGSRPAGHVRAFGKRPALTRGRWLHRCGGDHGSHPARASGSARPFLAEHGYHAVNENFDWGQASRGMEMFCRYFTRLAKIPRGS